MNINDLIRDLRKCTGKEEQESYLTYLADSEKYLEEYIHKTSGECKELLDCFAKCTESMDTSTNKPHIDPTETNICQVLNCITQVIELCLAKYGSLTIDDLHKRVAANVCSTLLKKHFSTFIKRCLFLKQNTKPIAELQLYLVKFLRLCVKENKANLKQIAIEFSYFQDNRTWLDKFIHQNNSYNLRVEAVKFLLSFLTYAQDVEIQIIIRKIFLQQQPLSAVQSLFSTLSSSQFDLIEHTLEELLFKVIKNLKFTKSDKVRLFNERNLIQLMKLYNWKSDDDSGNLYEILTEFFKVLFASTQYGISFYDRTLGIQLATAQNKNLNHLIFNSIVSLQSINKPEQLASFNNLLISVFKVCPDLIQRFYKYKYKQVQQQQQGIDDTTESTTNLMNLSWLVDLSVSVFEQQRGLIQKGYYLKRYLNETIYSSVEYICELIVQTSIPTALPLVRMLSNKTATLAQRFKYIAVLIKSLHCLNEWKTSLTTIKSTQNHTLNCAKFLEKNTSLVLFTLNQQLFANKYLPTLDVLNINDIVPAGVTISATEIVQLIDLYSLYFDLILNTSNLTNDDFAVQNMLQIEHVNQKFLLNLTNLMLQNDESEVNLSATADTFMKFLLHFIKLKQLYDTNENFEVIVNELVYKLLRLLIKYGFGNSENALNSYIKLIEIAFVKLIQVNERNEFNESLFQLWFILFYKFTTRDKEAESEVNFFIDYADCCLKNFFAFKMNSLFGASVESGNEIQKMFLENVAVGESDEMNSLSTFLILDCSIQTFAQFKRRFSENNQILAKIEQFLEQFLMGALLLQRSSHEFSQMKAYLEQKGFQVIVDRYAAVSDASLVHQEFVNSIESSEFTEVKVKNCLCLVHRSFEASSLVDEKLLVFLLDLCKPQENREKSVELILNDGILRSQSFKSANLIEFLINLADLDETITSKAVFDDYLNKFLQMLDEVKGSDDDQKLAVGLRLIAKLKNLSPAFLLSLNYHKNIYTKESMVEILLKNRETVINNENLKLFEKSFRNVLKFLSKFWEAETELSLQAISMNDLDEFLCDCLKFKRNLCGYLLRRVVKKAKKFDSFMQYLSRYLSNFVKSLQSRSTEAEVSPMETDDAINGDFNSTYGSTLSLKDQQMIKNQFKASQSLNFLRFTQNFDEEELAALKQTHLNIEVKLADFISERLNAEMLEKSIINFPVARKLADILTQAEITVVDDTVYDPVYLLANFFALLYYGNIVDVSQFTQTKCLSYLFVSLSSKCERLRSMAYGCLFRFNSHLENSKFYCKDFLSYLIKLLRNSIEMENQRIPSVVALFLAQLVPILMEPGSPLYKQIVSFLLLKPTLDLANVPEFYKFFNSSSLQHKNERKWILNILRYGLKTTLDFRLYEKRFIYRQLLAIYDSKFSDYETKVDILELIKTTCEIKPALIDLVKRHYLILWLTNSITKLEQEQGENLFQQQNNKNLSLFYKLCEIYLTIWLQISEPPALFLTQMFGLLKIILQILDKITVNDVADEGHELVKQKFFKVAEHIVSQTRKINETQGDILNTYSLTEADLDRLFRLQNRKLLKNKTQSDYFRIVVGLMQNQGYTSTLSRSFMMKNTRFILNFISDKNSVHDFSKEEMSTLLATLENMLNYSAAEGLSEESFHEFSINIVEFLLNHHESDKFSPFYQSFGQFIQKIKNTGNEEITVYDENEKKFLSENCYSIILG